LFHVESPADYRIYDHRSRWLIDNGRELDGKQVIADLHGGDLQDPIAIAEYEEIKLKVREEVSETFGRIYQNSNPFSARVRRSADIQRDVAQV